MELVIAGYFNRIDKLGNLRLVNLEEGSMEKLKNCGRCLYPSLTADEYRSPVVPNGVIIKHDTRALCYDVDGVPTSTGRLLGQLVEVRLKVRKYSFGSKNEGGGDRIVGWNVKLLRINPLRSRPGQVPSEL